MIKPVFILLFTLVLGKLIGQVNLVPNGSFEEYYECPNGPDLGNGQFQRAKHWWSPSLGTCDYFNSCNSGDVNVPNNFWGVQDASDGNAYGGFVPAEFYRASKHLIASEYMMTRLRDTLQDCSEYRLSFDLSLAEYSTFSFSYIGAYFSKDSFFVQDANKLPFEPSVMNSVPLTNTENWKKLTFTFYPNGDEEFLTIGHFGSTYSDTLFISNSSVYPGLGYGYYFIDNVVVERIGVNESCIPEIPNIVTPNGDGINDFVDFSLITKNGGVVNLLNRWGENIKEISYPDTIWDPAQEKLTDGIYFYRAVIIVANQAIQKTGFIQLVR